MKIITILLNENQEYVLGLLSNYVEVKDNNIKERDIYNYVFHVGLKEVLTKMKKSTEM